MGDSKPRSLRRLAHAQRTVEGGGFQVRPRYGPIVMNTEGEILEAIEDFRAGRLRRIA